MSALSLTFFLSIYPLTLSLPDSLFLYVTLCLFTDRSISLFIYPFIFFSLVISPDSTDVLSSQPLYSLSFTFPGVIFQLSSDYSLYISFLFSLFSSSVIPLLFLLLAFSFFKSQMHYSIFFSLFIFLHLPLMGVFLLFLFSLYLSLTHSSFQLVW